MVTTVKTVKTVTKAKPSKQVAQRHSAVSMTALQAARVRRGELESKPSDYERVASAAIRLGKVRRALEDRQMLRELGLLDP